MAGTGLNTKSNNYVLAMRSELWDHGTKAIFAALAYSFALRIFGDNADVDAELAKEWQALYDAKIVPQAPTSAVRNIAINTSPEA